MEDTKLTKLEVSHNGTLGIISRDRAFIPYLRAACRIVCTNFSDDPFYKIRSKCSPFFQMDYPEILFIEFWSGSHEDKQNFVDAVNHLLQNERRRVEEIISLQLELNR